MKGLYMKKIIEYHIKTFVFKQLMRMHLPVLWNHLVRKLQINIEMITTPWIMTVFTGWITDPKYILPIFDNFIFSIYNAVPEKDLPNLSWIFIFSVILTIFYQNQ